MDCKSTWCTALSLDWSFEFEIIVAALCASKKVHPLSSFYSLYHKTCSRRLNEPWVTVEESFESEGKHFFFSV